MLQNFFLKQLLSKQMAQLPKEQQERVLAALGKNPKFFNNLAGEIGTRIKNGEPQMAAIIAVVSERKAELETMLKA